jgi:hypothetical protein
VEGRGGGSAVSSAAGPHVRGGRQLGSDRLVQLATSIRWLGGRGARRSL